MILKLMSAEDLPDHDNRKRFRLLDGIRKVIFHRDDDGPSVEVYHGQMGYDRELLTGNAYVLSDAGKTIDSFAYIGP